MSPIVTDWNERDLSGNLYPFLVLDALYIRVRNAGRVRSYGVLLGTGVRDDGHREILGLQLRQTEDEVWTDGRKYFDMEEYWDWMESQASSEDTAEAVLEKAHEFAH